MELREPWGSMGITGDLFGTRGVGDESASPDEDEDAGRVVSKDAERLEPDLTYCQLVSWD